MAVLLATAPNLTAAARPADVAVMVKVERIGGEPIRNAYVALIPIWRPFSDPLAERMVENGSAQLRVPPGTYYLVAGAHGFQVDQQGPLVISSGASNRLTAVLRPPVTVSGNVHDERGEPLAGVRVADSRGAILPPFDLFSAKGVQYFSKEWETYTDGQGNWSLALPSPGVVPMLFEVAGRAAQWRLYRKDDPAALDVTMPPGTALRLTLDRVDPNVVVTLDRAAHEQGGSIPPDWQRQVWARWADQPVLEWRSLPAGVYSVYARYPDPHFFGGPATLLTTVAVDPSLGAPVGEIHVTLPPIRRRAERTVAFFLPNLGLNDLSDGREGRASDPGGLPLQVETAVDQVIGGSTLFFNPKGARAPFVAFTVDRFIAALDESETAAEAGVVPQLAAIYPRADAMLTIRSAEEDLQPPATGSAVFRDCQKVARISVPLEVRRGNVARLTGPAGCRGTVLSFDPFEPVVVTKPLKAGDQFLGDYLLHAAAMADIHLVRDPGGEVVSGATLQAFVTSEESSAAPELLVAEAVSGPDGWAHLPALPVNRTLQISARSAAGDPSDPTEMRLDPRARKVVDPLRIPKPATLLVTAQVSSSVAARFPSAKVVTIYIEPADPKRARAEERQQNVVDGSQPLPFGPLRPGRWKLAARITFAGTDGLLDFDEVELKAGETRRVEGTIEPLIFEGRVTSGGMGVAARIEMMDPLAAGMVRPHIKSQPDGSFHVLLPHRGKYNLVAVLLAAQSDKIPLGEVDFADPALPMDIALPATGTLIARVLADQRPATGVLVSLDLEERAGRGQVAKARYTDSHGTVRFERLVDGKWLLSLRDERTGKATSLPVILGTGQEREVELQMPGSDSFKP